MSNTCTYMSTCDIKKNLCKISARINRESWSEYSKNCLKRPLKNKKTKIVKTNDSLMKVESIEERSKRAFWNNFDLHYWIICLEKQY